MTNLVFAPGTGIGAAQTAIEAAKDAIKERYVLFVFSCFVPHYTSNDAQDVIIFLHIISGVPTELSYNERSIFIRNLTTEISWTIE